MDILDVGFHISFLRHCALTIRASIRLLARVSPFVAPQVGLAAETFETQVALVSQSHKIHVFAIIIIIFHTPHGPEILQRKPSLSTTLIVAKS